MSAQVSVADLQAFFLRAAAATYAGGIVEKGTNSDLPRSKVYRVEEDQLLYIDTYFTNREYSVGETLIYVSGLLTWTMQYHGWCREDDPEVLAFLRRALMVAYSQDVFHLGRGPAHYQEEEGRADRLDVFNNPLVYDCWPTNVGIPRADFVYFQGRERIWRFPDQTSDLFWHRFSGMLLRDEDHEKQPWLPRS